VLQLQRIIFLFTYAKLEYVSLRTYPSKNRIPVRTLRILEPYPSVSRCHQYTVFLSLNKNAERVLIKFVEGNHYYQQIK